VIATLLPASVRVHESADPRAWHESPLPRERAEVSHAVPKRRIEHGAVRDLARRALAELGVAPVEILTGPGREPLWPAGVVGSLTHCDSYCAAAVASSSDVVALGIDAEPATPLDPGLLEVMFSTTERVKLRELDRRAPGVPWSKVAFSVKETIYKAWFPFTGRWLSFHDVDLTCDPDGWFNAQVLVEAPPPLTVIVGRFVVAGGLVCSATVIER